MSGPEAGDFWGQSWSEEFFGEGADRPETWCRTDMFRYYRLSLTGVYHCWEKCPIPRPGSFPQSLRRKIVYFCLRRRNHTRPWKSTSEAFAFHQKTRGKTHSSIENQPESLQSCVSIIPNRVIIAYTNNNRQHIYGSVPRVPTPPPPPPMVSPPPLPPPTTGGGESSLSNSLLKKLHLWHFLAKSRGEPFGGSQKQILKRPFP